MSDYTDKSPRPIPIGTQRYAYQCEDIAMEPVAGAINIRAWIPSGKGKEPYPNPEKEIIHYYNLKIERFTANAMTINFTKRYKDGSEDTFLTTVSFSDLVNRLFKGNPANFFHNDPPTMNSPAFEKTKD